MCLFGIGRYYDVFGLIFRVQESERTCAYSSGERCRDYRTPEKVASQSVKEPNIEVVAQYDESPHLGKDESGFNWNESYVALWVRITNSSEGPLENVLLTINTQPDVAILKGEELSGAAGTTVGLPNMPRPMIFTKGKGEGVMEENNGPMEVVANIFLVRSTFWERGQPLLIKMATQHYDLANPIGTALPGRVFPQYVVIKGVADVRTTSGLKRMSIKQRIYAAVVGP